MSEVESLAALRVRSAAMRLALALTLALAACGGETSTPTPSRCTPGTSQACACASGSGVRPCLADGTYGGCSCPMPDAGMVDVAVSDVATDAPRDVPPDGDPRCMNDPGAVYCSDIGACADLQRSTRACGRCGNACPDGHRCCRGGCVPPGDPCQ